MVLSRVLRRPPSLRTAVALLGALVIMILGLLTVHLHGAAAANQAASHSVSSTVASAQVPVAPVSEAAGHTVITDAQAAGFADEGSAPLHLDLITACIFALLTVLALAVPMLLRSFLKQSLPRMPQRPGSHVVAALPGNELFRLLGVIRT